MSKPDLVRQIITSREAKKFLSMVTKDFYNDSYLGLWIFEVIGREWDEMRAWAEGLKNEINPQTCTWSIAIWEWVYGIEADESLGLEFRRQRILAKICAVKPINPEMIRRGVAALIGAEAEAVEVNDFTGPYRFEVILHPQETPFPYNRIEKFIREIKPSHLAFDTLIETKVLIRALVNTDWALYGNGMTGMYNAGTRPGISIRARPEDLSITAGTAEAHGETAPEQTGTVFAAEQAQRMPQPSTSFRQEDTAATVTDGAAGYQAKAPVTREYRESGRYPDTAVKARLEDEAVTAETDGAGYKAQRDTAGTKPDIQHYFRQADSSVTAGTEADSHGYTADRTGTKPGPDKTASLQAVEINPGAQGRAYKTERPGVTEQPAGTKPDAQIEYRQDGTEVTAVPEGAGYNVQEPEKTGTKPGVTMEAPEEQPIGGVLPVIEGEGFAVQYPMCGTGTTKE